ncbi:autophagy-related protein 13-like isoform X2 [Paramacrobiotus metropolitanus]|uniref:autophagy-related protein 13-like isoform X2 n=1 Tax=Paramacrobiotus metropolitanus TaxID=2943436 RepID=UPI002445F779|nr:autophagy-related protein 13-like isoform X2 [Paramacrobiotus metropolitanus]
MSQKGTGTWAVLDQDEFDDLQKYVSILAQKAASLIVEARTGQKCSTSSKPSNADWFGLAVREVPNVRQDFKEMTKDHKAVLDKPFGVEIIARLPTSTEEIPIEYWWLWFDEDIRDQDVRVRYLVYNRMAVLLKSIIVSLRASPVNKLVRQNDYFKFSHRLFVGKPNLDSLSPIAKNYKIGPLKTPYGSIFFMGACRETAFSETQSPRSVSDPVPVATEKFSGNPRFAFHGRSSLSRTPEKSPSSHGSVPAESPVSEGRIHVEFGQFPAHQDLHGYKNEQRKVLRFADLQCTGAFAVPSKSPSDSDDDSYELPDRAFATLYPFVDDEDDTDNAAVLPEISKSSPKAVKEALKRDKTDAVVVKNVEFVLQPEISLLSHASFPDDGFDEDDVLEAERVRPAFAPSRTRTGSNDLANFYHTCQLAPVNLKSLEKRGVNLAHTVKSLNQNLMGMESQLHEFDKFVEDLRQIGDSSWVMTMSSQ